jgi:hypothetical protein
MEKKTSEGSRHEKDRETIKSTYTTKEQASQAKIGRRGREARHGDLRWTTTMRRYRNRARPYLVIDGFVFYGAKVHKDGTSVVNVAKKDPRGRRFVVLERHLSSRSPGPEHPMRLKSPVHSYISLWKNIRTTRDELTALNAGGAEDACSMKLVHCVAEPTATGSEE